MNTKLIIALITALFLIIILGIFFTHQNPETIPLPQNIEVVSEQIESQVPLAQIWSAQRSITIIPTERKKRKVVPVVNREAKTVEKASDYQYYQPSQGIASNSGAKAQPSEVKAGITTVNKERPTAEKIKELNSKGIIIY